MKNAVSTVKNAAIQKLEILQGCAKVELLTNTDEIPVCGTSINGSQNLWHLST